MISVVVFHDSCLFSFSFSFPWHSLESMLHIDVYLNACKSSERTLQFPEVEILIIFFLVIYELFILSAGYRVTDPGNKMRVEKQHNFQNGSVD